MNQSLTKENFLRVDGRRKSWIRHWHLRKVIILIRVEFQCDLWLTGETNVRLYSVFFFFILSFKVFWFFTFGRISLRRTVALTRSLANSKHLTRFTYVLCWHKCPFDSYHERVCAPLRNREDSCRLSQLFFCNKYLFLSNSYDDFFFFFSFWRFNALWTSATKYQIN